MHVRGGQNGDDESGELERSGDCPRHVAVPEAERDEGSDDQQEEESEPVPYLLASYFRQPQRMSHSG